MRILTTLAAIAVVLIVFGAFGWLGIALAIIVVSIWWLDDEDDLP